MLGRFLSLAVVLPLWRPWLLAPRRQRPVTAQLQHDPRRVLRRLHAHDTKLGLPQPRAVVVVHARLQVRHGFSISRRVVLDSDGFFPRMLQMRPVVVLWARASRLKLNSDTLRALQATARN